MKYLYLLIIPLLLVACTQHVRLEPSPVEPCVTQLHDYNMIHREYIQGFRGDCKDWTYLMQGELGLACTFPFLTSLSGVELDHMALGILTHEGLFVSDVNKGGIVHINNAGYRNQYEVLNGGEWVKAEIKVE